MNEYYILRPGADSEGPIPETELRRRLQVGELAWTDLIAQEGWSTWEPAERMFERPRSATSKPIVTADDWLCTQCGYAGAPQRYTPGNFLIEVILWLCAIVPGLIYSIWRISARRKACPRCHSAAIIPPGSPRILELRQVEPSNDPLAVFGRIAGQWFGGLSGRQQGLIKCGILVLLTLVFLILVFLNH